MLDDKYNLADRNMLRKLKKKNEREEKRFECAFYK